MRPWFLLTRLLLPILATSIVIAPILALAATAPEQYRTPSMLALYTLFASLILVTANIILRRRRWIQPSRCLEQAAARMARGEWDVRVQPHGSDAMQRMAVNLNQLAAQAYKQLSDLQQQRGGLQALVDTLPDPILAIDPRGRITLMNVPASKLLSLQPQPSPRTETPRRRQR